MAASDYINEVQGYYLAYYGRFADQGGLTYWSEQLDSVGGDATMILDAFGNSAEADSLFGSMDNTAKVNFIYNTLFGRDGDAGGVAFYVARLESGEATAANIAKQILDGASGLDAIAINNKIVVANGLTESVLPAAYAGDDAAAAARAVMETVTGTQATPTITYADALANVGNGDTFTLTTGADVATANVFNSADVFVPGTGYVNTLNDNDVLTGTDADDDTLNAQIGTANDISATIEIQPTLNSIEIVNVEFINSGNNEDALNLRDATGVTNVNVNRVADNTNTVDIVQMDASVTNVSFNDQTESGVIGFEHQEEILTGTETLNFMSDDARAAGLNFREAGDGSADTGFYFETINFTTDGNNDFDAVTIQGNGRELILDPTGDYDQTINFTANNAIVTGLEINDLTANGAEFINIEANAGVQIADDNFAPLDDSNDGISTDDLETMTITGAADVMIDGIDTTKQDTVTLTIDGSTATGDLMLGIKSASDATDRDDVDLMVTTGTGNDEVRTYEALAGSIMTSEGDDIVAVRDTTNDNNADMEGVSRIMTGEGDDTVMASDLLAFGDVQGNLLNSGADDAAQIDTGAGNDTVTVAALQNATDWDDNDPDDNNADDRFAYVGAQVTTGEGEDTLNISGAMAENTLVDMGSENDTVNYTISGLGTVLADDDGNAREYVSVDETTTTVDTSTLDIEGAHMVLGSGDDNITFTDIDLPESATLLVAAAANVANSGAKIMGGASNDTLSVSTTDNLTVVSESNGANGVDTAAITGVETINLTIENAISEAAEAATGLTQTDTNDMANTTVSLDVLRVDSDLTSLNLVSNEDAVMTLAGSEQYRSGDDTTFNIDNMRSAVDLTLMAYEATGVVGATNTTIATGALQDDTVLAISTTSANEVVSGAITQTAVHNDVTLNMTYAADEARGLNDADSLTITAVDSFDITLEIDTATNDDRIGNAASTTDDDTVLIENFTLTFTDAFSHSVNMSGFGDVDFRGGNGRPAVDAGDVSSTAETSFTLNSGAAAGQRLDIDNVNADTIRVMNADGSAVTAANVTLRVDASNNYDIVTGSGTDIIDMRLDDVRSDDNATAVDRKDSVDAGAGRDTLIVNGNDDLGTNDNVAMQAQSMIVNDDVFAGLDNIETILVDAGNDNNGANGDLMITLDEQAGQDIVDGQGTVLVKNTNVDTVRMIGDLNNQLDLVIGNNFTVGDFNGDNTLLIDTAGHRAATVLNIESKDDDTDLQLVNMDILVAAKGGTDLTIVDAGNQALATTEVTVYTADETDVLTIAEASTALADGIVNINTGYAGTAATEDAGAFDSLTILEGITHDDNSGAEKPITVTVADRWTNTEAGFKVDASTIFDTDGNSATGGMTLTVQQGDDADLTVQGTQQNDTITTGRGADTINGNAGNDIIVGDEVVNQFEQEMFNFTGTYDKGDVITITHNSNAMTLTINADGVAAAAVVDAIVDFDADGTDNLSGDNIIMGGVVFGSAVASANGNQVILTGATAGTDYVVSGTVNNAGDNTAQTQTLSLVVTDGGDYSVDVVWNGTTYTLSQASNANQAGTTAFIAAVGAAGGTAALTTNVADNTSGTEVLTITGPVDGSAFPLITQATAGAGVSTATLALVNGDTGTDNADPVNVTETLARTVNGDADVINGGQGDDTISGLIGADKLDGGSGVDTLDYSLSLGGVTIDLAANTASGGDAQGDTISNFENVTGTMYDDVLTGSDVANVMVGGFGDDVISTGAGNDTINAGAGSDTITGGTGNDVIALGATDGVEDTIMIASGDGVDTITEFEAGTDTIEFTDFAGRDLDINTILTQTAAADANDAILGNETEMLLVTDVVDVAIDEAGTAAEIQEDIAIALGGAFDMTKLTDGKVMFVVSDDDANSYFGYYTESGNDDVVETADIEILGVTTDTNALSNADFWLAAF